MSKIAVTAQGVEQIMRDAIRIGNRFGALRSAIAWWRTRCREMQSLLNEAVQVSRAQAANFTAMKHRAEEAESRALEYAKKADAAGAAREAAEEALRELHALVLGECPSLLNEDSGGDARLDMAIDAVLAGHAPEPDHIADLRKMVSDRERRLQRIRASKGDRVIHLDPVTAAVGQNEYEGGYLVVVDSQCRTEKYRILSNTGPSIGVPLVVLLAEELRFDIGELSDVSLEKARAALAGTTEDAS